MLDEVVDERAHLRGQMAPARVSDVDLDLRQPEIRQQPHERAARDIAADQVARQDRDTHPEQRELAQHRGVVRNDHVGRAHAHFAVRPREHTLVTPVFGRQAQARVLGEMLRMGRHAVLLQVARRRTHGHAAGGQAPRDDARATHLARDDDADVEAFLDEINLPVDQREIGHHFREILRVRLQHGRKVVQAEHDRRNDAQRSDRLVIAGDDHLLDVLELIEDLASPLQIDLA